MKKKLNDFVWDNQARIHIHPAYDDFSYSDGTEVEKSILRKLQNSTDIHADSFELDKKITDWASEYHFSRNRNNLLRHINIDKSHSVLELGSGCGTITRQLGESGAKITGIEGSKSRAEIARERCRDLKNVDIYCSNFNDISFEHKYDVVTLIGVLEYAPLFLTESENAVKDVLQLAKHALKGNGRLIIAIENQIGLKYFCGATEDHLSELYVGIEDRYNKPGVITFGQHELNEKLKDSGFNDIEFQYPFPDYKLPNAILFERSFSEPEFIPSEIIRHDLARDYSDRGLENIDTTMVWPVLERNKLMQAASNSFLVIASKEQFDRGSHTNSLLALRYTTDRKPEYNTITSFLIDTKKSVRVVKEKLLKTDNLNQSSNQIIQHTCIEAGYIYGRTLHSHILHQIKCGNLEQTINLLNLWISFLLAHSTSNGGINWDKEITGNLIDCLPTNLILNGMTLEKIDMEWDYKNKLNVGSLALRYLIIICDNQNLSRLLGVNGKISFRKNETLRQLLLKIELISPNKNSYRNFCELHDTINKSVFPNPILFEDLLMEAVLLNPDTELNQKSLLPTNQNIKLHHEKILIRAYKKLTPWPIQKIILSTKKKYK